jgi:hypothetical protein
MLGLSSDDFVLAAENRQPVVVFDSRSIRPMSRLEISHVGATGFEKNCKCPDFIAATVVEGACASKGIKA